MTELSSFFPSLTPDQVKKLERLADVFLTWNRKLNLSALRDREGVLVKHVIDSLLILPWNLIRNSDQVLDLGTGGGFPGLPLAIAYPRANFTLVDATAKKIKAVEAMAQELRLHHVLFRMGRAEELGREESMRERFDVVVTRALAEFPVLLEYALPFVKVGGMLIAYQGPDLLTRWEEYSPLAEWLGSKILETKISFLPHEQGKRSFILVRKIRSLSLKYPRRVGIPSKKPLLITG